MISRSSLLIGVCVGYMVSNPTLNAAEANSLHETRATLEKWVETRQLISKTKIDWQADKETLGQTLQLFERELKSIEEQMGKLSTNSTQADKEREQAQALMKRSNESLDRTRQFAADFEKQVVKLVPQLPSPLQDIIKPLLNRLPSNSTNTTMAPTERVLVLVTLLGELEKFNNAVTIFSEKRKNGKGEEVAVETVYVGLGAAYFVNEVGDLAGTGAPGPNGWVWTNQPDLASRVRDVIQIYKNERGAKFVALPAVIR